MGALSGGWRRRGWRLRGGVRGVVMGWVGVRGGRVKEEEEGIGRRLLGSGVGSFVLRGCGGVMRVGGAGWRRRWKWRRRGRRRQGGGGGPVAADQGMRE